MRQAFDHQKPITPDFSIDLKAAAREFSFPSSKGQKISKAMPKTCQTGKKSEEEMIRKLSKTIEDIYLLSLPNFFFGRAITG